MRQISFNQQDTSAIGLGTWRMGEGNAAKNDEELKTIQYALNNGVTLLDTAEIYGDGQSETLIGKAIKGFNRSDFQIISKFAPNHATPKLMKKSLENSLKRLQTDYLDLYLLHWRGSTPLEETIQGLQEVQKAGYIKNWGVSNFDIADLEELSKLPGGSDCRVNEDLYNVGSRGIEYSILPWQKENNMSLVGYSPFGSDGGDYLTIKPVLKDLAKQKNVSVYQLLLAWVIRNRDLLSIPKSSSVEHLKANMAATDIEFTADELELIDSQYPRPNKKTQLEVI
ncbi:aldo/keto reductase [Companilactobacillus baiquanensis]|uniref:Aldo/keto reductase n=1 Tax=Companilactobacillus baiquanensis TaxID=2486005 RepID=A0ABW1UW42_9LACO|nr:aldo/keto reductase [Companilactobacillus baiquanensis]